MFAGFIKMVIIFIMTNLVYKFTSGYVFSYINVNSKSIEMILAFGLWILIYIVVLKIFEFLEKKVLK